MIMYFYCKFSFRNINILFDLQSWPNEIYVHNILRTNKKLVFASYMVTFAISLVKKNFMKTNTPYPCIYVSIIKHYINTFSLNYRISLSLRKMATKRMIRVKKLHVKDFDIIISTHWILQRGRQYKKINGDWSALHKSNKL